jgi:hypothetical protein
MERETGLEPATSSLGSWHSTTELLPHSAFAPNRLILLRFRSENSVYTICTVYPFHPVRIEK